MSEYIIVAVNDGVIMSFRCNRKQTAELIEEYLSGLSWAVCWFNDPPLIGQVYKED